MALFGVNFGIYYLLLQRSVKKALRNEELRMYLLIMVLFSLLIFVDILPLFPGHPGDALAAQLLSGGQHHDHHRLCDGGF